MFRFTIRDVLLLMVVVAFAVLWGMEMRQRKIEDPSDVRTQNVRLHEQVARLQSSLRTCQIRVRQLEAAQGDHQ